MSSPTRQMSSRKLPPLPGSRSPFATKSNAVHSSTSNASTATIYSNEKRGVEKSNKDLSKSLNDGPFRPALVSTNSDKPTTKDSPKQCKCMYTRCLISIAYHRNRLLRVAEVFFINSYELRPLVPVMLRRRNIHLKPHQSLWFHLSLIYTLGSL
jgi:hypothetical protein